MISGFVGKQIRRTNRNLLIANILLAAIVLVIPILAHRYLAECFNGPYPTTINDIARLNSPDDAPHTFVTIPLDQGRFEDFGYSITGGSDHKNDYFYFYRLEDGRHIAVNTHSKDIPSTFEGSIASNGGDIETKVLPEVSGRLGGALANVSLDGGGYRTGMYVLFALGIPALALAAWNISKGVRRTLNPLLHPIARELAKIGPPEEIAIAVDAEIQAGAERVKKVLLTTSWLANMRSYAVDLVYLGDVAWAYKQETKHKKYGVTVNTTYSTIIHDVRGRKLTIQLSKQQVEALIRELAARVPWAYVGFDPRLKQAWEKQRPQLLATIEERKQQALNPGVAPASPTV